MPLFTKDDFLKPEIGEKLSVIIMNKMKKPVLTAFKNLKIREKKEFNELLNQYIQTLGEDWDNILTKDFNETCQEELFDTENFMELEKISCPVGECELLLTEEQKQFQEDMKDPVKYQEWYDKLQESIIENERIAEELGRVHKFPTVETLEEINE